MYPDEDNDKMFSDSVGQMDTENEIKIKRNYNICLFIFIANGFSLTFDW